MHIKNIKRKVKKKETWQPPMLYAVYIAIITPLAGHLLRKSFPLITVFLYNIIYHIIAGAVAQLN